MNYAIEFYEKKIFSLEEPKLFKEKVDEANKIEYYFSKVLPNTEYIIPYILMSYSFEKDLSCNDRIKYIIGLVYASDYVDLDDLFSLPYDKINLNKILFEKEKENDKKDVNNEPEDYRTAKISIWKFTAYSRGCNNEEFLDGLEDDINYIEDDTCIEENHSNEVVSQIDNTFSLEPKVFDNLITFLTDSRTAPSFQKYESSKDILDDDDENISIAEKLKLFESKQDDFIEKTLTYKYKNKMICEEDFEMIIRAMHRWFDYVFTYMHDLVDIQDKMLEYNDKNIIKFL